MGLGYNTEKKSPRFALSGKKIDWVISEISNVECMLTIMMPTNG